MDSLGVGSTGGGLWHHPHTAPLPPVPTMAAHTPAACRPAGLSVDVMDASGSSGNDVSTGKDLQIHKVCVCVCVLCPAGQLWEA